MNFKKIGLVLLFIAVTGSVGFLLYRIFFAPAAGPPEVPPEESPPGVPVTGLPPSAPGAPPPPGEEPVTPGLEPAAPTQIASGGRTRVEPVEEQPVTAPFMNSAGSLAYYNQGDGRFYRVLPDGSARSISERTFPSVENVTWSPQGQKAIMEFPDATKIVYDFETQEQVTLPSHWEDFDFAQSGETFAAKSMSFNPDNRWLITANSDGSNPRLVEHLGDNADKVTVEVSPDSSVVALSETGDAVGFDARDVLLIGQNNENFKALRVDGFGFQPKWSPSGTHLLYSSSAGRDGYRPMLWFVAAKGERIGQDKTNLGLNTWADKCTFASDTTVYCAVPDVLPEGAGLQRDLVETTPDSIWKIDLRSGATTLIGRPENDTPISTLSVSQDERTLFFQDAATDQLESMQLR